MNKPSALPRRTTYTNDITGVLQALSDLQDEIRKTPEAEFKTFEMKAGDVLDVSTRVRNPRFISINAISITTGDAVPGCGASFVKNKSGDGLTVTVSGLLLYGNKYSVTLKIEGDR